MHIVEQTIWRKELKEYNDPQIYILWEATRSNIPKLDVYLLQIT